MGALTGCTNAAGKVLAEPDTLNSTTPQTSTAVHTYQNRVLLEKSTTP